MMNKILTEKVDLIKKSERPYGIILVGSSANKLEELENHSGDIDIFVIRREGSFEREVSYIDGVEFDVSYITLDELRLALERELGSIISIMSNYRSLYIEDEARDILSEIKRIHNRGPRELDSDQIDYARFKLTKSLDCLERKLYVDEFELMAYTCLKEILVFQFAISGSWTPPDKKLISSIDDMDIKKVVDGFLVSKSREDRFKQLSSLLDLVLGRIGGRLDSWNKSEYPFDFN